MRKSHTSAAPTVLAQCLGFYSTLSYPSSAHRGQSRDLFDHFDLFDVLIIHVNGSKINPTVSQVFILSQSFSISKQRHKPPNTQDLLSHEHLKWYIKIRIITWLDFKSISYQFNLSISHDCIHGVLKDYVETFTCTSFLLTGTFALHLRLMKN